MPSGAIVGDTGTEHDDFPATPIITGSPDVKYDGSPAARAGDSLEAHDKPSTPSHPRTIAAGSSSVFINGKAAAMTGSAIDCGGTIIGSSSVNLGA